MNKLYYLDEHRKQTMSGNDLQAFATLHHDELMQVSLKDTDCKVVCNNRGWITAVTDRGNIVQGWAGMFTVC